MPLEERTDGKIRAPALSAKATAAARVCPGRLAAWPALWSPSMVARVAWAYTQGTARPLHVSRGLALPGIWKINGMGTLRSGSCSPRHLKWYST